MKAVLHTPSSSCLVDHDTDLREILRRHDVQIYNSDVIDERYFPRAGAGVEPVDFDLLVFPTDMSLTDGVFFVENERPGANLGLWHLATISPSLLRRGEVECIIAFGAPAAINGILTYPRISFNLNRDGLVGVATVRADFGRVSPTTAALVRRSQQVLVRRAS